MPVRDTSRAALLTATKAIVGLRARIMTELMLWPATRFELAQRLGKPINCITAPVLSLIKDGKIEEHTKVARSGSSCESWELRVKGGTCNNE